MTSEFEPTRRPEESLRQRAVDDLETVLALARQGSGIAGLPIEELGIPDSIYSFARKPRGLVLVTGPTGSGKSTTLAAILKAEDKGAVVEQIGMEDLRARLKRKPIG